jgi:dihydroneopterin aldolase / 2-amino-4-hydroxy-6-hydroxymethyldihydropteridine diphosphokinase / dihydropteroate synthase
VPVVLMHSRGDSVSMSGPEATDYSALGGVVRGVRLEMEEMVERAERAGVKRWNIILDPGIGFAKSVEGNITLLRNLDKLAPPDSKLHGYPILVGASRKRFIGAITGKDQPKEREYGNAAVTSMCCGSGVVHVIRVHEPGPTKDVISMWAAV